MSTNPAAMTAEQSQNRYDEDAARHPQHAAQHAGSQRHREQPEGQAYLHLSSP
jgi:hypothetical protein